MSDEDIYYQKLLEEREDDIKKLENKIKQLCDLFTEHTRKINDYMNELKNIEQKMIEISK